MIDAVQAEKFTAFVTFGCALDQVCMLLSWLSILGLSSSLQIFLPEKSTLD